MERKSFDADSGNVACWVDIGTGPNRPWLAFPPGLPAGHTLFDAQMAHFSGRANCLVWDAPAHGESRPYPLNFTMDDLAHILHGVLPSEGMSAPSSWASHSAATSRRLTSTCTPAPRPASSPSTPRPSKSDT